MTMNRHRLVPILLLVCMLSVSILPPGAANGQSQTDPAPIFQGDLKDGLPKYVCAADAFASYYTLQQMQSAGLDVKHKFHLGIVPFLLDGSGGKYDVSEEQRGQMLANG